MANVPYYFAAPDIGIRKGIVEAHAELFKANKMIYEQMPFKLSLYKSFRYRKNIEFFFERVAFPMETFTEIERLKKMEVKHYKELISKVMKLYVRAFVLGYGLSKIFHLKSEWKYKYKLIYVPFIPLSEYKVRFAWAIATGVAFKFSDFAANFIMCFYYPSLLADLQIGDGFEIGYWTTKFVKSL